VTHCGPGDVSCERLILEKLLEFEEGTMPETERLRLQHHIEECPPCVRFLSTYRATGRTLRMLKPREIPPALAKTVMSFVRSRAKKGT
jgi:putative zinc finger protein